MPSQQGTCNRYPVCLQTDRLNAVSKGQMRPLTLESAFSLGQNQAQIQTQTHGPYGLHKVMIEGHRSLEALYSNPYDEERVYKEIY